MEHAALARVVLILERESAKRPALAIRLAHGQRHPKLRELVRNGTSSCPPTALVASHFTKAAFTSTAFPCASQWSERIISSVGLATVGYLWAQPTANGCIRARSHTVRLGIDGHVEVAVIQGRHGVLSVDAKKIIQIPDLPVAGAAVPAKILSASNYFNQSATSSMRVKSISRFGTFKNRAQRWTMLMGSCGRGHPEPRSLCCSRSRTSSGVHQRSSFHRAMFRACDFACPLRFDHLCVPHLFRLATVWSSGDQLECFQPARKQPQRRTTLAATVAVAFGSSEERSHAFL